MESALTNGVIAIGEVLWDVFEDSRHLGGAPLNFSAHVSRLKHRTTLISAVGVDELGATTREAIAALGLDTRFLQTAAELPTGTATVQLAPGGQPAFCIRRPAAYDAVKLSNEQLEELARLRPGWLYYGTLFSVSAGSRSALSALTGALPQARRFYDVNLRPQSYTPQLVCDLLRQAHVVKLNETELDEVREFAAFTNSGTPDFCREGAERYGWQAACVTLGARGCAVWSGGQYAEADGFRVDVADTVGAGDAFAAGFLHGLDRHWEPAEIATFANRLGALVASRPGGIPAWTLEEAMALQ